jgi:hypothetical protein
MSNVKISQLNGSTNRSPNPANSPQGEYEEGGVSYPYVLPLLKGITKLRKTATQSIATGAWRTVTWDVVDHDNLSAVNLGSSSSNIVVPTGITLMRAALRANWDNNSTSARYLNLTDGTISFLSDIRIAQNETLCAICSGWTAVTAAATLHLEVNSGTQTLNLGGSFSFYPQLTLEWATGYSALHA